MKLSIQTGGIIDQFGVEKGYELIAQAGFEAIDWNINSVLSSESLIKGTYNGNVFEKSLDEIMAYFADELSHIRKNGLDIALCHAPFPCYTAANPELLDYTIGIYKKLILFCEEIGCKYIVIHGISPTKNYNDDTVASVDALNDRLYTSLIPELRQTNVTVCLENLFAGGTVIQSGVCSDPREAVEMIDLYNQAAGKECFALCLDVGHMNLMHHDPRRYIPVLGNRIKTLHVHDNSGISDQHKAPYTGTVDWKAFCSALKSVGYDGDLSFETFNQVRIGEPELVKPWLDLHVAIGRHFIKKITSQN